VKVVLRGEVTRRLAQAPAAKPFKLRPGKLKNKPVGVSRCSKSV
jgi:hypothetical protein